MTDKLNELKRVVIFGATGFIGFNLLCYLRRHFPQLEVMAMVRRGSKKKDILEYIKDLGVRMMEADITDAGSLDSLLSPEDIVIHSAGYVGSDRRLLKKINVEGTVNIVNTCSLAGIRRLVYISSVAVLSGNKELPLRDDMPLRASMGYGASKVEAEKLVWKAIRKGLPTVILRPAMVYGKGEPHMLPLVFSLMRKRVFFIFGKGENYWHLCAIENLIEVIVLSMIKDEMLNRAFIVADEEILPSKEIFSLLAKSISAPEPHFVPENLTKVLSYLPILRNWIKFMRKQRIYDISNLKAVGYNQLVPVRQALLNCGP